MVPCKRGGVSSPWQNASTYPDIAIGKPLERRAWAGGAEYIRTGRGAPEANGEHWSPTHEFASVALSIVSVIPLPYTTLRTHKQSKRAPGFRLI